MSGPIGIPSEDELERGAYPWDTKVRERVAPGYEIALLTWGGDGPGEELGLSNDPEMRNETMWALALRFLWARVAQWDGTVEDVWLLMQGIEDRERMLRTTAAPNVDDDVRMDTP